MLPVELGNIILHILVNDHDTLYTLSLVSGLLRVYVLLLYLKAAGFIDSSNNVSPVITYEHTQPVIVWCGMQGLPTPPSMWIRTIMNAAMAKRQLYRLAGFFISSRTQLTISNIVIELHNARLTLATCKFLQTVAASGVSHLCLKSRLSSDLRAIESPEDIPVVNSSLFYPRLQKMQVKSAIFFSAEYISWTVHTLNSAALTALDLQLDNRGSPSWRLILPHLHMEHLETLYIDGALPINTIFHFLLHHPSIRELQIGRFTRPGFLPYATRPPNMDHLEVLTGSHDYIIPLLAQGLPALQRLAVIPDHPSTIGLFLDSELRGVINSARRCTRLQELNIALFCGYIAQPESDSFFIVDDPQHLRTERGLSNVRTITIRATWDADEFTLSSTDLSVLNSLPGWLDLFPSVQHLRIVEGRSVKLDADRRAQVTQLYRACPYLEDISMYAGDRHLADCWKREI
ncbi:hypothetical protein SCP_0312460 [Sparassis crispa]|uniref:F-box domain-containing protein n=1 Tax=Sparassis crispa TaxID=139825 RepID=A0A401GH51_9APHY|nr:hypothetical protein SCP_0312460 [Sparassis crispa]GBE81517.1 hypothetical protein SCP_0312460 [Sparassis crispa]